MGGLQSRSRERGEEKILDTTGTRTPTPSEKRIVEMSITSLWISSTIMPYFPEIGATLWKYEKNMKKTNTLIYVRGFMCVCVCVCV
jgi:hypothetical protein